jgi:hypothetical protein
VVQHLTHPNAHGGFVSERNLCERITHEYEVNASRLGKLCGGSIPCGDDGEVTARGVDGAHVGNRVPRH